MTEVLPSFRLVEPRSLAEAVAVLGATPDARAVAGGTDLIVQLRRGLSDTATLVGLARIPDLRGIAPDGAGLRIGAAVTLAEIEGAPALAGYPAILRAASGVAGPSHRQVATLGGNLCLDTRCVYYNQSRWWRESNGFCLKHLGDTCHVAPQGNRCRAAFSGDLAPALMVHGAEIEIAGADGTRRLALADFYNEDGADHLRLAAGEIVVAAYLPAAQADSDYRKIRVRGALDFPLAGVAVACRRTAEGGARVAVALTGTNSRPLLIDPPAILPAGAPAEPFLAALDKAVQKAVSPQRTSTVAPHYRRLSIAALTVRMARDLL